MDVMAMKRQGLTIKEIAEETGYHPSTISSWLRNGGPPPTALQSPPAGDRRAVGGPDRRAGAGRTAAAGHQRLRDDQWPRGMTGSYVSVARHLNGSAGPAVHRRAGGVDPDRDRTGRGVPVRLVRRRRTGRGSGVWARSSASRPSCPGRGCGSGGSPPRSTGSTPSRAWSGSSRRRRGPEGPAHRPDGGAGPVPGPAVHPPPAGGRLRPVPRHRDPGLPGQRRQAQGQGGAPLPGREGAVLGGVRRHRAHREALPS